MAAFWTGEWKELKNSGHEHSPSEKACLAKDKNFNGTFEGDLEESGDLYKALSWKQN